jgi:CRP/FNR family nitrogen fixation transcriptional regulator
MNPATATRIEFAVPAIAVVLERVGTRMIFPKGSEIFGQAENAELIHALVAGAVRTTRFLGDGRRQIGNFYYRGDVIGPETGPVHLFSAEALTDCTIHVVRQSSVRVPSGNGELDGAIWDATRRELERTQRHLLVLGRKSACERVAGFLLELGNRDATVWACLAMGRQDMADYLGLTIETVSRMVTQLQDLEIVEFTGLRQFRVIRWDELEVLAA